jgi:hypothetical protein
MSRLLVVLLAGAFLTGCGVLDDEGPEVLGKPDPAVYGPAQAVPTTEPATIPAPPVREPSAAVAKALDGGAIAVVDLTGEIAIEPESLDTASDLTLEGVRWSHWGADGASGSGRLRMLTCQPTCASSGTKEVAARVTLSGVKRCDGRSYFAGGEVLIDPKDTPSGSGDQPATYLRAPC